MEKFNLISLQNKAGRGATGSHVEYLIGALILIVLATSLAPTLFSSVNDLNGSAGVPTWVPTVLFVIVGAGLVFMIWKAFNGNA